MKYLVTGSSGYLGSHLVEYFKHHGNEIIGIDITPSGTTSHVGSIVDREFVKTCCEGVDAIFHTASLHKPHIATHTNQDFIDTNVTGTLNLLEAAISHHIPRFIFTSTTSVYGKALVPSSAHKEMEQPSVWVTESMIPIPKNIYGITKLCAENLCKLFYDLNSSQLSCLVLRTSRFFPEENDNDNDDDHVNSSGASGGISDENKKYNEYLHRRVHIHDVITAHIQAYTAAEHIGYGIYIISSTSPFTRSDTHHLRSSPADVVEKYYPEYREIYERRGWKMSPLDRVYVNERAREELGWIPQYDYKKMLSSLSIQETDENEEEEVVGEV